MNEYMQGAIFACFKLAKSKAEFKANVKKVTGYTDEGFEICNLCQYYLEEL